jgi:hypothetical protein
MTVRKTVGTVGTLAQGAVSTAVTVVKHPIGSTALAAGLVKGAAGAGIGLVRSTMSGASPTPHSETSPAEVPAETLAREDEAPRAPRAPEPTVERDLPGPDLAHFEPPLPEDLPELIVIEADDAPVNGESGEPFHNEPKATSRESEHGAGPIDPEELDEYVEDITTPVEGGPQQ